MYAIYMYSVITVLYGDFLLTHTVHVHVTVIHEHVLAACICTVHVCISIHPCMHVHYVHVHV